MLLKLFFIFLYSIICVNTVFYDSYYGTPMANEDAKHFTETNRSACVTEVEPCDPNEGRRLDGTCNNLRFPSRGANNTPYYRLLPAAYSKGFEPRVSLKSGKKLPLSRYLRTRLLQVGRVSSQVFTQLVAHCLMFINADTSHPFDIFNYVLYKPYCCSAEGKSDFMCTPNEIPHDDPVHRFSNIRCMNMTRPSSFQLSGCIKKDTTPERLTSVQPLLDLSSIYGNIKPALRNGRTFSGGLLKYEVDDKGRIWPPSATKYDNANYICIVNEIREKSRCHDPAHIPVTSNGVVGINLFSVWFWRQHNKFATELSKINPCWDDDKLFAVAREINIAYTLQMFYYELFPAMMGKNNLIKHGVLIPHTGFRDVYNESIVPQLSLEFPMALRWTHTIQESTLKMYDKHGVYMKQYPATNLTWHTGYIAEDDNLDYITQGSFRQAGGNVDYVLDPDMADIGVGKAQQSIDLTATDLAKDRHFGFQPYIKYREYCSGKSYKTFYDLLDIIDPERVEILKDVYETVEDIDLLAGMWVERRMRNANVPPMFFCFIADQLMRNMVTDRHWYERHNRPNAFTYAQLQEIRKASVARLLCDVGDTVTHIQPNAFLRASRWNKITCCSNIKSLDLRAWEDNQCKVKPN